MSPRSYAAFPWRHLEEATLDRLPGARVQGRANRAFVAEAWAGDPSHRAGGGRTRLPERARRGCSPVGGESSPGAVVQAGASLEPQTALTRGRAGAGRWP